ncbi:hypothetical protein [Haloferula rosea]|uniref:Uncharacterized protein n=1 Tax=Haloferula rosea TaxID=490093 RepID=A0A934RFQ6_9BACT|nr:hypothetical protein [Haloferula rosea]MBK1828672.1 hypothetical protein [Haloferula rosea]
MKLSLILSFVILFAGGMIGWHDQRRLVSLRTTHETLVLEARSMGVEVDEVSEASKRRLSEREAEQREEKVRLYAARLVSFVKRAEENEGKEGPEMQREMVEVMDGLLGMDAKELTLLVGMIRNHPELDEDMRSGLIGFSLVMLSEHSPRAALTIYAESGDLMAEEEKMEWVVSAALNNLAQSSPLEALDWIRQHSAAHPELVKDDAKRSVVAGASVTDPALAFRLMDELDLKLDGSVASSLAEACRGVDERGALLRAMEDPGVDLEDAQRELLLQQMARPLVREGFEAASEWLENAGVSEDAVRSMIQGIDYHQIRSEAAEWIEWTGERLEGAELKTKVSSLVGEWTKSDYRVAGEWLTKVEEGPVREAGVVGFTEAVAQHDPEVAAEWARTLPRGDDRERLAGLVFSSWSEVDPAAAAAFAVDEGLAVELPGE